MSGELAVHIGTYAEAGGAGLVPLTIGANGTLSAGEPYVAAANASFAAAASRSRLVYLVDEAAGAIGIHRREPGGWRELARVASGGDAPCYVALDADERRLAVANYESGHAALFELDAAGLAHGPPALFRSPGTGPVAERQEGPHAHCVQFSDGGAALYVVDLGADRIVRLPLEHGRFGPPQLALRAPAGSGPRHLKFLPERRLAVLLSELASTLTLLAVEPDGVLRPLQVVSTAPSDFQGENLGGHLELDPSGRRVYASNRGHNSVAIFALAFGDRREGRLEPVQHVTTGGDHPRHFQLLAGPGLSESMAVVAHENDGAVAAFTVDGEGSWRSVGRPLQIPGACSVVA